MNPSLICLLMLESPVYADKIAFSKIVNNADSTAFSQHPLQTNLEKSFDSRHQWLMQANVSFPELFMD